MFRRVLLSVSLLILLCCTAGIALVSASSGMALLGGTVLSIDQETLSVTMLMPTGESRVLVAVERRLLQGINVGDHVTFELNKDDKLIKLIKLPTDPAN
jgi:hypothetical protein